MPMPNALKVNLKPFDALKGQARPTLKPSKVVFILPEPQGRSDSLEPVGRALASCMEAGQQLTKGNGHFVSIPVLEVEASGAAA